MPSSRNTSTRSSWLSILPRTIHVETQFDTTFPSYKPADCERLMPLRRSSGYRSPSIITGDTYRPDLLLSTSNGMLYIVELTVGFESNLQKNVERKQSKYKELIREQKEHFNAVKFSSLGVFAKECSTFIEMLNDLDFQKHHQNYCIRKMTTIAIRTTYYIFCCRNKEWTIPELLTV